jgi:hypothetical protein
MQSSIPPAESLTLANALRATLLYTTAKVPLYLSCWTSQVTHVCPSVARSRWHLGPDTPFGRPRTKHSPKRRLEAVIDSGTLRDMYITTTAIVLGLFES